MSTCWIRVNLKIAARTLIKDTLNIFLKFEADIEIVKGSLYQMAEKTAREV